MKERADGFGFIPAVFKRDCGDSKNMRNERDTCFLTHLASVSASRIDQRLLKLFRQLHSSILQDSDAIATALRAVLRSALGHTNASQGWLQRRLTCLRVFLNA